MGKAACTFKEVDLTRAFRAAKKAGVDVSVEIDLRQLRLIWPGGGVSVAA